MTAGVLLALLAAAPISVPKQGASAAVTLETPAGPVAASFESSVVSVIATLKGVTPAVAAALKGGAIEVAPVLEPGKLKTRHFGGERWKCIPSDEKGKWVTESHDDLLTGRVALDDERLRGDPARIPVSLRGVVSPSTNLVQVRFVLPKAVPVVWQLQLERPIELPPAPAAMLAQYQKLGAAAVMGEWSWDRFKIVRVHKDVCGDAALLEEPFDASTIQTLAYPSHDWRLLTAHGWVFAEPVDTHREVPIPAAVDFTRIDPKQMTYLGDLYSRELRSVDTSPGKAVATFELGDFSGCFGASCGDPVNVRQAVVTFAGGSLSTKINRPKPAPEE